MRRQSCSISGEKLKARSGRSFKGPGPSLRYVLPQHGPQAWTVVGMLASQDQLCRRAVPQQLPLLHREILACMCT